MRSLVLLIVFAVPAFAFAHGEHTKSAPATTQTSTSTASADSGPKYELNVTGMHCQSCVSNLTKSLEAISDIEKGSVKVDLKGNKAVVTLKKGALASANIENLKKTLNEKLTSAGFTVTDLKVMN